MTGTVRRWLAGVGASGLVALAVAGPSAHAQTIEPSVELGVVIAVAAPPVIDSDGVALGGSDQRLRSLGDALEGLMSSQVEETPFALAVSPVLCDELALANTAEARRLQGILRALSSRAPMLTVPYADARLPDLESDRDLRHQVALGQQTLATCTGRAAPPTSVLFPPDLSLDDHSLEVIPTPTPCAGCPPFVTRVRASLAPAASMGAAPARAAGVTLIPADIIPSTEVPSEVLVRFRRQRIAAAVVTADRSDLGTFVAALANDPRVALRPLPELIDDAPERSVPLEPTSSPPAAYLAAVRRAQGAFDRFQSYTFAVNPYADIVRTAVGRARSSAEWDGRWETGIRRARRVVRAVDRQEGLITAAAGSVTFTSQRGSLPVTVTNRAAYPVRLRVSLSSAKLTFPEGSSRVVTVDPPGDTIVFAALARSTGTFPVQARVTSPDRGIRFHVGEVTVRSTAANVPALALTIGGAVFLVGWSIRHIRQRRREAAA